jgi:hypothetical protein
MSSHSLDKSPIKSEIFSIEERNRAVTDINPPTKKNSSSQDPNAPDQDFEDQDNLGVAYNKDKSPSVMTQPDPRNQDGPMEVKFFEIEN